MTDFKNTGEARQQGAYSFSWLIMNGSASHGNEVYFGLNGDSGLGGPAHLANSMSVEDAEAIGYSLLAAAKAAREANGNG